MIYLTLSGKQNRSKGLPTYLLKGRFRVKICVAGIGSRETPADILLIMEKVGVYVASKGYTLRSGNATGADQAFARGVNRVDPSRLELHLPWNTYNKEAIVPGNIIIEQIDPSYMEIARKYHPNWAALKQGGRSMMARNIGIVTGVVQVICWMDPQKHGGTGQGVRYAAANKIPVINLFYPDKLQKVLDKIK